MRESEFTVRACPLQIRARRQIRAEPVMDIVCSPPYIGKQKKRGFVLPLVSTNRKRGARFLTNNPSDCDARGVYTERERIFSVSLFHAPKKSACCCPDVVHECSCTIADHRVTTGEANLICRNHSRTAEALFRGLRITRSQTE